ncbi:MAG: SUMF1/EgtB/PvdO family nonheme iron enzyme [Crocosphaera sp.]
MTIKQFIAEVVTVNEFGREINRQKIPIKFLSENLYQQLLPNIFEKELQATRQALEAERQALQEEGISETQRELIENEIDLVNLKLRDLVEQLENLENPEKDLELAMVYIPGGTFFMGAPDTEKERDGNESPQHKVTVPQFFMSRYLITQAQWRAIASRDDLKVNIDLDIDPFRFKGDRRPVESITWYQAMEFCQRLSKLTGRQYTLPSEAQWEYACRAVKNYPPTVTSEEKALAQWNKEYHQPFHFGATLTEYLANYNWSTTYAKEQPSESQGETTEVGTFPPNAFGLYDMHGNVYEWCLDHLHDNYNGAPDDGSAWLEEDNVGQEQNENDNRRRLLRGGSYDFDGEFCRSANRNDYVPRGYLADVGLRVVLAARTLYPFFL